VHTCGGKRPQTGRHWGSLAILEIHAGGMECEKGALECLSLTGKDGPVKALLEVFTDIYFVSSRDRIRYNDSQRARHEWMWLW